ncbi:YML083C domain-containing protein [Anaeromyxobacter oryzisoli]|uniref:hypothetical protein n=1 Tax=Anaeromyxobacter oryzisoli TaxID=2925408 RepID=UPI001F58BE10|nr:hypothetical protein [Anaeromyxobacter sp. SG63]
MPRSIALLAALLAAAAPATPLAQPTSEGRDPEEEPRQEDERPPGEAPAFVPPCFAPPCFVPPGEAQPERPGEPSPPPSQAPSQPTPPATLARPPEQGQPPPAGLPRGPPSPSQATPAGPPSPFKPEETWWDATHAFLEEKMFAPVNRLDRFFSDERELEAERSRSFMRLRSEVKFREDGAPQFGVSLRADLRFPGLGKRLERFRLVIAGESEETQTPLFPNDPTASPLPGSRRVNAELRYRLWDSVLTHVDLGAGVLVKIPPGAFTRVRYRLTIPVDGWFLTRYAATGFWRTDTGFGTSGEAAVERPLGPMSLARVSGRVELSERSHGGEWGSELAFLRTIGPRRAISVGAAMQGATSDPVTVSRYRIYTRLRREVWRRWLFVELEPEVAWPWTVDTGRYRAFGVTLRLEVQFQGNENPVLTRAPAPSPAVSTATAARATPSRSAEPLASGLSP